MPFHCYWKHWERHGDLEARSGATDVRFEDRPEEFIESLMADFFKELLGDRKGPPGRVLYPTSTRDDVFEGYLKKRWPDVTFDWPGKPAKHVPKTYAEADLVPGSIWQHLKTGGWYSVLCVAQVEKTLEKVVVYRSGANGQTWTRPAAEFLDGRFVHISDSDED